GVSATGYTNTWIGGYLWQTSSNSLLKLIDGTGSDTLSLEGGIKADDLTFSWTGVGVDNLQLTIAGGPASDSIRMDQQKTGVAKIEKLQLDGLGAMNFVVASAVDATAIGSVNADILFGLGSNDYLNGDYGNDILYGGAGDDQLEGGDSDAGNDTLVGQTGDDYLNGCDGSDTYIYRPGDGNDIIRDMIMVDTNAAADINAANQVGVSATGIVDTWVSGYYWQTSTNSLLKAVSQTGSDTLTLTGGIATDDLSFSWTGPRGEDLVVTIDGNSAGEINISQQATVFAKIEKLQLDGVGALNLVVAGSAGATANGSSGADFVFGVAGNEMLNGNAGNDILMGGIGNDTLVGGAGNDQYHFRAGDGSDTIVESGAYNDNDELDFGTGIDANELWFA
ncbi:calcium-binding protein, partial [Mesorhizobium sp. B3-1-8]|uniref:calcium-binding protein n=1 Tax=Mesorhizobium sp. B3-1-8 TaxID=2589893 RepID=UPI00112BAE1D